MDYKCDYQKITYSWQFILCYRYVPYMPKEYAYAHQKSGYVDTEIMQMWFEKTFLEYSGASPTKPVLLLMDNHSSHVQLKLAETAVANNVHIVLIPPHSSHFLQPLDQVFNTLKDGIEDQAHLRLLCNAGMGVNKP